MMKPSTLIKRNAGQAPGGFGKVTSTHNSPGGRPENQGISTQRHRGQRPPTWPRPSGADALDLLQRLFRPARVASPRRRS